MKVPYGHGGKEFKALSVLFRHLKNKRIDIVHSNCNLDRTVAAVAGRLVKAINFSSILICMSIRRNLTHAIRNKFLIDHFTPIGFATKRILVERDRIPPEKISVIPPGIPENEFLFDEGERSKVRKEFNISEDEIVIGAVSRLVDFKGHVFLLKAFSELQEKFANLKLLIIGDGPLREELIAESKKLNISQRTIFAGSRNSKDVLSAIDIFAQTPKDFGGESLPVSMLEAMSVGLPLIASNVGDISALIDGTNGFLVEPESVQQIVKSTYPLLESENLRKEFGASSRKLFLQKFTLEKMADKMEKLYLEELERAGKKY